jgi:methylated-DNA-protein-cysteine methyltransferase-like protein
LNKPHVHPLNRTGKKRQNSGTTMTESTLRIIAAIRAIPPGKVSSYRDTALAAGIFNGARQVVRVLHSMSASCGLPWHRIVRADGRIALPAEDGELQARLLRSEGVRVSKTGRIDLVRYGYKYAPAIGSAEG